MKTLLFGLLCVTWFLLGSFTTQLVKYSANSRTHCIYQGVGGTIENKNEELSRNYEIIKKYENDTGKYYKVEPQYEYHGDEFGNGDMGLCGIDVIEVTREEKYPEPIQNIENKSENTIESDDLPF